MVHRAAHSLAGLTGWRRHAAAAGAGAIAVLALPPLHVVPALFVALPVLLWLLDGAGRKRSAFAIGWWFGLGFFVAGLYWIANALLIDAARFAWMIPFAVGGLSAVLAVYVGLTTLAVHALAPPRHWARVVALAGAWGLAEWVRGWALTGFPWNPLGTVWMPVDPVVQSVAWIGVFGLSVLTVLVAAMPATLGWARAGWAAVVPPLAALAVLVAVGVAGALRLEGADTTATVDGVRLRLVQPNIPQADKWAVDRRAAHLYRYVDLSRQPPAAGALPPTHVIWGETAVPFALDGTQDRVREVVAEALGSGDGAVLTGAVRRTPRDAEPYQVWNSLVAIDGTGAVRATYDKAHLVPFGEYVPLRSVLPLDKITPGATDFSAGVGPTTIGLPGLPPASPLVCYEVIFPGSVIDAQRRPGWMINVTNDGWYGVSSGPHQHFATSRLRAVEEGLPLVRVANTGISAIVDPYGRVLARIGLDVEGVADGPLPVALPPTPFARLGNTVPVTLAILLMAAAGMVARRPEALPSGAKG